MAKSPLSPSKQLIELIESQALEDIKTINVSSEKEDEIDFSTINIWYLETEKLIRILANILPSTMAQPINQLRYAGHHILKAALDGVEPQTKKANLIEAYKHCKRGYYDAIDLYV
ncbi:hypothetical protein CYQ88_11305, partial [Hydrogenovibrio sp. SC-1]|uniref:hypothetical protein n=1 Tax=Hydrogenovibrio sp. SC-1 TaxID=2065820 RepID=UPI000CC5F21D